MEHQRLHRIGYFLVPGFALMSFAAVSEPFRAANILASANLYQGQTVSLEAGPVADAGGAILTSDAALGATEFDTVFVFAAGDPGAFDHAPTLTWLRRLAAAGVTLGGISGGAWVLARAGLLDGYRATIHWEHAAAFAETFQRVMPSSSLYVVDRKRLTGAGGAAGFDLAVDLIGARHGDPLARAVRDWFVGAPPREGAGLQRLPGARFGVRDVRVAAALAVMESDLEASPSRAELANASGVGLRQLERLFARELGVSIEAYRRQAKLEQADILLRQTARPILDIALACGFASASQFARAFGHWMGVTPSARRRNARHTDARG